MTTPGDDGEAPPRDAVTIWDRVERARRGPRPALTHDLIARAAVEIADEHGLDAVSMRRLADRLGVATMALYRYVSGKSDVFELMIDAAYAEVPLPEATGWRAVAEAYARSARAVGLRHPWLTGLMSQVPVPFTPRLLALTEHALAAVDGLGLDVDTMMAVFGTVNAFTRGAVAAEVAERDAMRSHGYASRDDLRDSYLPQVRRVVQSGRYPTLVRYIVEGSNTDDPEWQFEFGLACVLDGIAARLGI